MVPEGATPPRVREDRVSSGGGLVSGRARDVALLEALEIARSRRKGGGESPLDEGATKAGGAASSPGPRRAPQTLVSYLESLVGMTRSGALTAAEAMEL